MENDNKIEVLELDKLVPEKKSPSQKALEWEEGVRSLITKEYEENVVSDKWVSLEDFENNYLYLRKEHLPKNANQQEINDFNRKVKICSDYMKNHITIYGGIIVYTIHDNKKVPIKYCAPLFNTAITSTKPLTGNDTKSINSNIAMGNRNENPKLLSMGYNKYRKLFIHKTLNDLDVSISPRLLAEKPELIEKLVEAFKQPTKNPTLQKIQNIREHIEKMVQLCKIGHDLLFGDNTSKDSTDNPKTVDENHNTVSPDRCLNDSLEEI